VRPEGEGDVF